MSLRPGLGTGLHYIKTYRKHIAPETIHIWTPQLFALSCMLHIYVCNIYMAVSLKPRHHGLDGTSNKYFRSDRICDTVVQNA